MRLGLQNIIERAYLADPRRTENDLIEIGRGDLAAICKVDYESGRLRENQPQRHLAVRAVEEGSVDSRAP